MAAWSVLFRLQGAGGNRSFQRSLIEKDNLQFGEVWSARGALRLGLGLGLGDFL